MNKKLFSCLSVLAVFGLTACDGKDVLSTEMPPPLQPEPKLNSKMLRDISQRVTFKGTINEKYGIANNILDVEVSFTESSYHWVGEDDYTFNEGRVFNIGGIPMICGVNLQNERIYQPMKDDEGQVEPWQNYANPFSKMTIYDFFETDEAGVYDFRQDLEQNVSYLNEFVIPTITNYQFWDLAKAQLVVDEGRISGVYFETSTRENELGDVKLIADFEIVAVEEEVEDLEYPGVLPTLPEHEKLAKALNEASKNPIHVEGTYYDASFSPGKWEEATIYKYNAWHSSDLIYVEAIDENPIWHTGSGYYKQNGMIYNLKMEADENNQPVYTRAFYEKTDEEGKPLTSMDQISASQKPNYLVAAPEWFTEVEENVFVCTSKTYAGTIAYNYSATRFSYARSALEVIVTLNAAGQIAEISFSDGEYNKGNEKFVTIGDSFKAPFEEKNLNIQEDPFNEFLGTYTGSCKLEKEGEKQEITIVVNSKTNVTINGEEVTNLSWDKNKKLIFNALGVQFEISHTNGSAYYYIYVNSESGNYIDYCQPVRTPLA